ncbi:MAG: transporter, partial [Mesorhizobium sp.]
AFICVGTVLIAQSGRDLGGRGHVDETTGLSPDKIHTSGIVR